MNKLWLILILVLFATPAFGVSLTWDQAGVVDLFQVEIDGQIVADVAPNVYQFVTLTDGPHIARVRAKNVWGWSAFSPPLDFTSGPPAVPTNLRVEF